MSSKKGPGRFVAAHQTEAARRALIQPVPCWEYKWVVPPGMSSGSTLRVRQWVRTEKKQEFSDDEDASQAALAPLPDEPEQGDEDEEDEDITKDKDGNNVNDAMITANEEKIGDGDGDGVSSAPTLDTNAMPSGLGTPLPAETSMRGVPGLDTPVSGSMTPSSITGGAAAASGINLASRLAAVASSSGGASSTTTKPHPLSTSFGPADLIDPIEGGDDEEEDGGGGLGVGIDIGGGLGDEDITDQTMLEDDGSGGLIDSMNLDAAAAAAAAAAV
ncbi:hypothetical protein FRC17_008737, partial [Serendipita sp. 399]